MRPRPRICEGDLVRVTRGHFTNLVDGEAVWIELGQFGRVTLMSGPVHDILVSVDGRELWIEPEDLVKVDVLDLLSEV